MDQTLDNKLKVWLQKQIGVYAAAMPVAETLSQTYDLTPESQEQMVQLNQLMEEAKQLEWDSAPLREQWRSAGRIPSPQLAQLFSELQSQLERLIHLSEVVEQRAKSCKQNLAPSISQHVQVKKTRDAYSR